MDDIIISEKKLEDIIYDHLSGANPHESMDFLGSDVDILKVYRQFNIDPYGVIDLITFNNPDADGEIYIDIFELKKDQIDKNALVQILRYKYGVEKYIETVGLKASVQNLFLIGSGISTDSSFEIAIRAIENLSVYSYDINAHGITLKDQTHWDYKDALLNSSFFRKVVCMDYESRDQECRYQHHFNKVKA